MTPERWLRVREVVESALELAPRKRERFLVRTCGADHALRDEVDTLLRGYERAGTLFDRPVLELRQLREQDSALTAFPAAIGPYSLLRPLAHGGMGSVYLAERTGSYRQRVAVKLLRPGMSSEDLVHRFRSERQILAQLEHPYIAKILDGGSHEGHLYLVMELIDGLPIDRFCDEQRLGVTARLELMRKVCEAVQFAHRNLVVHRDLKPANILVTAAGDPKLLDFGIAKLLRPETFPHTVLPTIPGLMPMTPDYASPEQVRGEPVTTASDVYALGALLYELLTGHSPYVLTSREPAAVARAVCEQRPERPSVAVARNRDGERPRGEVQRLRRRLQGDLDTIVLTALRKEPERRYASVEQLAEDLDRHVTGRPVLARPDDLAYRTRKFLRRNRWGVSLAAAVLAVPVAFTGALLMQRKRILRERNHAQEVARFLVQLFKVSDPDQAHGEAITAREILDQSAHEIPWRLAGQPELQADLMETMARVYMSLGLYDRAVPLLETARKERRESQGKQPMAMVGNMLIEGELRLRKGEYEAVATHYRQALETLRRLRRLNDPVVVDVLAGLATVLQRQGDYAAAEVLHRDALEKAERLYGEVHEQAIVCLHGLASLLEERGQYESADIAYHRALANARQIFGKRHPRVASLLSDLGMLAAQRGDFTTAERHLRESLSMQRRLYDGPHPSLASCIHDLAWLLFYGRGTYGDAEQLFREALAMRRAVYGERHQEVLTSLEYLGLLLAHKADFNEAESVLREAYEHCQRLLGGTHPKVADVSYALSHVLTMLNRHDEAEELILDSLDVCLVSRGNRHPSFLRIIWKLAVLRVHQGRFEEASTIFEDVLPQIREAWGDDHPALAELILPASVLSTYTGEFSHAEVLAREALQLYDNHVNSGHPHQAAIMGGLAKALVGQNKNAEAEVVARKSKEIFDNSLPDQHYWRLSSQSVLGACLAGLGDYLDAERYLISSYQQLKRNLGARSILTVVALERVIDLYELWDKPEKAAEFRSIRTMSNPPMVRRWANAAGRQKTTTSQLDAGD